MSTAPRHAIGDAHLCLNCDRIFVSRSAPKRLVGFWYIGVIRHHQVGWTNGRGEL